MWYFLNHINLRHKCDSVETKAANKHKLKFQAIHTINLFHSLFDILLNILLIIYFVKLLTISHFRILEIFSFIRQV